MEMAVRKPFRCTLIADWFLANLFVRFLYLSILDEDERNQ